MLQIDNHKEYALSDIIPYLLQFPEVYQLAEQSGERYQKIEDIAWQLLYNLDYNDTVNNIIVINNDHIRDDINIKSSMSDIIYKYRNKIFIIEMNKSYTKESLYKNHFYLFYKHIFGAENSNSYNSDLETYLIDIDNFDILDKLI